MLRRHGPRSLPRAKRPLPLDESEILALQIEKNRDLLLDGPPGLLAMPPYLAFKGPR